MLFHLFIFFSHMHLSIFSYSGGKLTIRVIHAEAAPLVRLVRPRPDQFSAGRWSHFQTAETVCQRDGWARCLTQARLCPACRCFSYKSFPLFCQQIMQEPGAARPDCIGTHVTKYTCVYDVQLLAIWHIPLLVVVPLLSLALRVGLMRRLPTSSCPFPFPKKPLTLFYIICTFSVVDLLAHARVIFYVQWPAHF